MNSAQLKAIAIGVGLLIILWGTTEMMSRRSGSGPAAPVPHLPPLTATTVDTIAITHRVDTVVLAKRSPGHWTVNGFAAETSEVNQLFGAVSDSATPELMAQDPSSFARMGVDSTAGRVVRLAGAGKTLATLFVGEHSPAPDGFYLRLPGDRHVYLWHGRLAELVTRPVESWRDHTIAAVPPDSIAEIAIRRGHAQLLLRRQGNKWTLAGAPVDSAAAARLVEGLRSIRATEFSTPRQVDSLRAARPSRSLVVRGPERRELLALGFDSVAGGFWVRRAHAVYRMDSWHVDQLTPTKAALAPAPRAK